MAQRVAAILVKMLQRRLEHGQLAMHLLAVVGMRHLQRAHIRQHLLQAGTLAGFVEGAVVVLQLRHAQQFGHHGLVFLGVLAQVHRGQMEAEHLHRTQQFGQAQRQQRRSVVFAQRAFEQTQMGQQFIGGGIGLAAHGRRIGRIGAGALLQRGRHTGVDADYHAAVRLVLAVHIGVAHGIGQCLQFGLHINQDGGHGQLQPQRIEFMQVVRERRFAMQAERQCQRFRADKGVAVAVAADPVAHAEERRNRLARQGFFQLGVQVRHFAQEGAVVVGQRVADFVGHAEFFVAQHARLPQLGDAGLEQQGVAIPLAGGDDLLALGHQLRNGALGGQDDGALHFGGVRRQHRRDIGLFQQPGDAVRRNALLLQPRQTRRQRTALRLATALVKLASADVMVVFRDVGQMREIAEGARHLHGLLQRQVLQQFGQGLAGAFVITDAVGHRQLADALHQFVHGFAFLLANHVAQQFAQQADIVDQGLLFVGRCGLLGHGRLTRERQKNSLQPSGPDSKISRLTEKRQP